MSDESKDGRVAYLWINMESANKRIQLWRKRLKFSWPKYVWDGDSNGLQGRRVREEHHFLAKLWLTNFCLQQREEGPTRTIVPVIVSSWRFSENNVWCSILFGVIWSSIWTTKEASIHKDLKWLEKTYLWRVGPRKQLIQASPFTQRKWSPRELGEFLPVSLRRPFLGRLIQSLSRPRLSRLRRAGLFSLPPTMHTLSRLGRSPFPHFAAWKSHVSLLGTGLKGQCIFSVKSTGK